MEASVIKIDEQNFSYTEIESLIEKARANDLKIINYNGKIDKITKRHLKIFWSIQVLNKNYFSKKQKYSTKDLFRMVNYLLEKDGFKKIGRKTLYNDLVFMEEKLRLIKSHFQPLGEGNGSFTFYIINKKLERFYKEIIINKNSDKLIEFENKNNKIASHNFTPLILPKGNKANISYNEEIKQFKIKNNLEQSINKTTEELIKMGYLEDEDLRILKQKCNHSLKDFKNVLLNLGAASLILANEYNPKEFKGILMNFMIMFRNEVFRLNYKAPNSYFKGMIEEIKKIINKEKALQKQKEIEEIKALAIERKLRKEFERIKRRDLSYYLRESKEILDSLVKNNLKKQYTLNVEEQAKADFDYYKSLNFEDFKKIMGDII